MNKERKYANLFEKCYSHISKELTRVAALEKEKDPLTTVDEDCLLSN